MDPRKMGEVATAAAMLKYQMNKDIIVTDHPAEDAHAWARTQVPTWVGRNVSLTEKKESPLTTMDSPSAETRVPVRLRQLPTANGALPIGIGRSARLNFNEKDATNRASAPTQMDI